MADFNAAVARTLKHEGGYQEIDSDSGNYVCPLSTGSYWVNARNYPYKCRDGSNPALVGTNFGIAAPVLAAYKGRIITKNDMKSLPATDAIEIYKQNFWDKNNLTALKDQAISELAFDTLVNHQRGAFVIQRGINMADVGAVAVNEDNIFGSKTREAINQLFDMGHRKNLNDSIVQSRIEYINQVLADNPQLGNFASGLLSRAKSFFLSKRGMKVSGLMLILGSIFVLFLLGKKNK